MWQYPNASDFKRKGETRSIECNNRNRALSHSLKSTKMTSHPHNQTATAWRWI